MNSLIRKYILRGGDIYMRRGPHFEWRYLLNTNEDHFEVHDLDNERTGPSECQIDEIIMAKNAKYLTGVNNEAQVIVWLRQNPSYDGCKYCLLHLHRK